MFIRLRRVGVTDFLIWLSWLLLMRNSSKLRILVRSVHVHWQLIHLRKHLLVVRMLTSISLCGNLHSHVRHGLVHSLVVYLNKGPLAHVLSTETSGVTHPIMRRRRIFLDSLLGFWALNNVLRRVVGALLAYHLIARVGRGTFIVLRHKCSSHSFFWYVEILTIDKRLEFFP